MITKQRSDFKQLLILEHKDKADEKGNVESWGTFKDSLRSPVHRWFAYPAGFSYKAVEYSFCRFKITNGMTVYDPFMGSGTTNVSAKSMGVNSIGVEAHSFVYEIAKAKMAWDVDEKSVRLFVNQLSLNFNSYYNTLTGSVAFSMSNYFPDLVLKCYQDEMLSKLSAIRELYYKHKSKSNKKKNFTFVVLTALLRSVSSAATGWPYIAPKKEKITPENKDALREFNSLAALMLQDLANIKRNSYNRYKKSKHNLILENSADMSDKIPDESVDHVFTSPPYLNNFDYSDRTRLELYFWRMAKNWKDITRTIRSKLMTSATTQIARGDSKYPIDRDFKRDCVEISQFIQDASIKLKRLRKIKGGKKSYDLMLIGYFNDIYKIIREVYRVLKSRSSVLFVLGDSAPYGIHIPTDRLIGKIGCSIGFSSYSLEILRERGDKWKVNPKRHSVALRESIVILHKG